MNITKNEQMVNMKDCERLLEASQVMYLLSCGKNHLDKLVSQGLLTPVLHGNRYKYFYREVVAYIEQLKRQRDRGNDDSSVSFLNAIIQ